MKKKIFTAFIATIMALNLIGCGVDEVTQGKSQPDIKDIDSSISAQSLSSGVTNQNKNNTETPDDISEQVSDFGFKLFNESYEEGKNILISPLSVLCALSMTANGADGETLTQMESVLGASCEELNEYIYWYMNSLAENKSSKLSLANSIWFRDSSSLNVNEDFLQLNADYYGADIYKAPFDEQTLSDINNWVDLKTDSMIKKVLDEIPPERVMYLINALSFDAEWLEIYKEDQISDGVFFCEDGKEQGTEFMYSEESIYLENENATGFVKYYKDVEYAFVALLPKEGLSVSELVSSLDANELENLFTTKEFTTVYTSIPKFEYEYDVQMKDILSSIGMPAAFNSGLADFSKLGSSADGNIYIGSVLHKTYITVDEKGTKAGAATVVAMDKESAILIDEVKYVYLDRPFVYMLIDCENELPFFIGTVNDPTAG